MGQEAENTFRRLAEKRGWKITDATNNSNIDEHWDFLMKKGTEKYKIDVKSMKRISRNDPEVQDEWVWIELHGVRPYDRGWLYDGKADLIIFEKKASFIIVKRIDLINLVHQLVDMQTLVRRANEAKYKVYRRPMRPDLITLIELDKLNPIKWGEWLKDR